MVKITGPLMSVEASGKIGERLVFSKRASGQQARFQKAQKDVVTASRTAQRALYTSAVADWNALSDVEKEVYRLRASNLHMSGYNLFMSETLSIPDFFADLVAYWDMNRVGYGTILDISENGNVGTLLPKWPSDAPSYVDSKNSKMDKALSFDGLNDKVSVSPGTSFQNLAAKSLFLWFKAPAFTGSSRVLVYGGKYHTPFGDIIFLDGGSNVIICEVKNSAGAQVHFEIPFTPNEWTCFGFTFNGSSVSVFKNGVEITPSASLSGIIASSGWPFLIGSYISSSFANCLIDEVMIFDRSLTPSEVLELYTWFN